VSAVRAGNKSKEPTGTKLALIQAAGELFALKGLKGTSTRAIAGKAGSNIGCIHYYFGGKENLYWAAVEYLFHRRITEQNVALKVSDKPTAQEVSDVLAELGKKVTILEKSKRLGYDIGITTRWVVLMRLSDFKVQMEKNAKVVEITKKGVKATVEGKEKFYDAGTVALTLPLTTDDTLAGQIEAKGYKVYRVGDCSASGGRIMEAVAAGFKAGYEI
jgi:AcrR family transcriptional regulator